MTWGEMRLHLKQLFPTIPIELLTGYLQRSYDSILNYKEWVSLRVTGVLTLAGVYNTGSVDLTYGSSSVTGAGTVWTSTHVGWKFHPLGRREFYTVTEVASATALTLDRPFEGETMLAGTYELFQDVVALPEGTNEITSIFNPVLGRTLDKLNPVLFREIAGTVVGEPLAYCHAGETDEGANPILQRVQIRYVPTVTRSLEIVYRQPAWRFTEENTGLEPPPWISSEALITRAEMMCHAKMNDEDSAQRCRGEYLEALRDMVRFDSAKKGAIPLRASSWMVEHRLRRLQR